MKDLKLDMERIFIEYPEYYSQEMIDRHIKRYEWALTKLNPDDDVLELCCGSGYGSKMVADKCKTITAYDKSKDAINYATNQYKSKNLKYGVEDLTNVHFQTYLSNLRFNSIVWIEGIEHFELKHLEGILETLKKVLLPNGKIIISTPDKKYSDGKNEYHLNEFSAYELKDFIRKYFSIEEIEIKDKFIYLVAKNG